MDMALAKSSDSDLVNQLTLYASDRKTRIVCLEELKKRKFNEVDKSKVYDALKKVAANYGHTTPDRALLSDLFVKLVKLDQKFISNIVSEIAPNNNSLSVCFLDALKKLDTSLKITVIPVLIGKLKQADSFTGVGEEICNFVVDCADGNEKQVENCVLPLLDSSEAVEVVYGLKIISKVGGTAVIPKLERILEKSLLGYYQGLDSMIYTEICKFFKRTKTKSGVEILLKILEKKPDTSELVSALSMMVSPELIRKLLDLIKKLKEENGEYNSIQNGFYVLEQVDNNLIGIGELLDENFLVNFSGFHSNIKKIVIKSGEKARSNLVSLLGNQNNLVAQFALGCLLELGINLEEYSQTFKQNPILQTTGFFLGESYLKKIFEERAKFNEEVKGKPTKLEWLLQLIFTDFGFVTLYVGDSQGVDLIVFSSTFPYLFLVGITTGILKNDVQNISLSVQKLRHRLPELENRFRIIPVIVAPAVSTDTLHLADKTFSAHNRISLLLHEDLKNLYTLLLTNRPAKEVIEFLVNKIPKESKSPANRIPSFLLE